MVDCVSKSYGPSRGLAEGFSCTIRKSESTVLLGSNGAGKTTLLSLIANLRRPDSGRITIDGIDASMPESRRGMRFLPEQVSLPRRATTEDLLNEYKANGADIRFDQVAEMTAYFECDSLYGKEFGKLSKGQRQILLLSAILSGRPKLVILDEPMEGLDPLNIRRVRQRIRHLTEAGTTVLHSTHRVHEAEKHGGLYMIIHKGRLVENGSMASIASYTKLSQSEAERFGIAEDQVHGIVAGKLIVSISAVLASCTGTRSDLNLSTLTLEDIYISKLGVND